MKIKGTYVKWGIFGLIIAGILIFFRVILRRGKWKPLTQGVAAARIPQTGEESAEELAQIVKDRKKIEKEIRKTHEELEKDAVIHNFNNYFGRGGGSRD